MDEKLWTDYVVWGLRSVLGASRISNTHMDNHTETQLETRVMICFAGSLM